MHNLPIIIHIKPPIITALYTGRIIWRLISMLKLKWFHDWEKGRGFIPPYFRLIEICQRCRLTKMVDEFFRLHLFETRGLFPEDHILIFGILISSMKSSIRTRHAITAHKLCGKIRQKFWNPEYSTTFTSLELFSWQHFHPLKFQPFYSNFRLFSQF